jgi:hypothetical protein
MMLDFTQSKWKIRTNTSELSGELTLLTLSFPALTNPISRQAGASKSLHHQNGKSSVMDKRLESRAYLEVSGR